MRTVHVAPSTSAAGSLKMAVRDAGRTDEVLYWLDDLSCGPIEPDEPSSRARWWATFQEYDNRRFELALETFWKRVIDSDDRLVVWFGRHAAHEMAFFLHWADRFADRPYHIVDVTGMRFPFTNGDGSETILGPIKSVGHVGPPGLRSLLGTERLISDVERADARKLWLQLRKENGYFRIVVDNGLASAPPSFFDDLGCRKGGCTQALAAA